MIIWEEPGDGRAELEEVHEETATRVQLLVLLGIEQYVSQHFVRLLGQSFGKGIIIVAV